MKTSFYCSSFSFILLFIASLSMNTTGQPVADIGLKSNGDAWQFYRSPDEEKPMPRVLLIGDSIVNGYRQTVRTELNDKALVMYG